MPKPGLICLACTLVSLLCACSEFTGESVDAVAPVSTPESTFSRPLFESGHVRALTLSEDGERLYVTNTPSNSLEIYAVTDQGLDSLDSVPVGLEPIAVAEAPDKTVWVVNHLSDSVSVVDVSVRPARIIQTLLTGDEPRDIVFAGENQQLAFITAAHRGQNGPNDQPINARLQTPSIPRADVWLFDSMMRGNSLGGDPIKVLSLFGDTPRALSTSADGSSVYVAVMNSGNQTTTIGESKLDKSGPTESADGVSQPDTGLIVKYDGQTWRDANGESMDDAGVYYSEKVRFDLPDYDVFELSADIDSQVLRRVSGVGTTLYNMIANPVNDHVYVTNTEALNVKRFEGDVEQLDTLRADFIRNRISIVSQNEVIPRSLNKHLNYSLKSTTAREKSLSVTQPLGMAISSDGQDLYVAAFGSSKIVRYQTEALVDDSFEVNESAQILLEHGGPTNIVLDEPRNRLYVTTRFDNGVAVVDLNTGRQSGFVKMTDPEPAYVVEGRRFLYDGSFSQRGDASCASCHVFGDFDGLAWDLGNPSKAVVANTTQFVNRLVKPLEAPTFHPLKGPMTTQSLRGLKNAGPLHWRGDKTGQSGTDDVSQELAAFLEFNTVFTELLGNDRGLSEADMLTFAKFALALSYPPNPIRALDNSLSPSEAAGLKIFRGGPTKALIFNCDTCHTLDVQNGYYGTAGLSSIGSLLGTGVSQEFKVPHLRNMYQKVGKFGSYADYLSTDQHFGPQIRGFGFMHDGNMDTLENFFRASVSKFADDPVLDDKMRRDVTDFMMVFDSDVAPIVGQQVTINEQVGSDSLDRLDLLISRALIVTPRRECALQASGIINGKAGLWMMDANQVFNALHEVGSISAEHLIEAARHAGSVITYTCLAPN